MQENGSHADQAHTGETVVPGSSAVQINNCISFDPGHTTKLEVADQCAHSRSDVEQEFSSDSLSLAQSKLLEDWRPEPLQLHSDSYTSSGSSVLGRFWCKAQTHCFSYLILLLSSALLHTGFPLICEILDCF